MKNIKRMTVAGYTVEYVDLREPKPRKIYTETAAFDTDAIAAAHTLGVEFTGYIRQRYERAGYHVLTISKASRRECFVDMGELYQQAGQGAPTQATESIDQGEGMAIPYRPSEGVSEAQGGTAA